jgi:ribonuclease HI
VLEHDDIVAARAELVDDSVGDGPFVVGADGNPHTLSLVKGKLSTDGGARGNPGPAAYGYVLEAEDGTVLDARGERIGIATNNVAEYHALVAGLEAAKRHAVTELEVVSDSELLVKQMRGDYKVKNEALRTLSLRASRLARDLGRVTYTAVRREHNQLADTLVNEALDA